MKTENLLSKTKRMENCDKCGARPRVKEAYTKGFCVTCSKCRRRTVMSNTTGGAVRIWNYWNSTKGHYHANLIMAGGDT